MFLEATGEVYQGNAGPLQSYERSDLSYVGRLRGYRDLTEATNLDIGTSFAYGHNDAGPDFDDAAVRRRRDVPLPAAAAARIYKRFLGRTELFWSHRDQDGGSHAFGMYVSGDTSSRGAGSPAPATTGPIAPRRSLSTRAARCS